MGLRATRCMQSKLVEQSFICRNMALNAYDSDVSSLYGRAAKRFLYAAEEIRPASERNEVVIQQAYLARSIAETRQRANKLAAGLRDYSGNIAT